MVEELNDARLKLLQDAVRDKQVTLVSKPPKPRGRRGRPNDAGNAAAHRGMHTSAPSPRQDSTASHVTQSSTMPKVQQPQHTPAAGALAGKIEVDMDILQSSQLRKGQSLGRNIAFCPWRNVLSYPGQYIGKGNRPRVSVIIGSARVSNFYLHNPEKPKNEPFLLVPTVQFAAFLEYINKQLGSVLFIPRGKEFKFSVKIDGTGMPKPRYLSSSIDQRTLVLEPFPAISPEDLDAYNGMEPVRQGEIQKALQGFSSRDPETVRRDQRRQREDAGMLSDAQRMLGIKRSPVPLDVVFVCIDAEALERKPNQVSEVGIAVLDTRDLQGVERGPAGKNWWPLIKAYHLRVKEYSGLRNYQFVQGCPDKFIAGEIMKVLKPLAANGRDLVLVGHDVSQDIKYIKDLGVDAREVSFIREIDSQVIHKSWRQRRDGRSLEAVLSELCMQFKYLHNAGNDAVYTLRAVIGVAVEQMREEELAAKGERYVPALFEA
ncbi:QDE-2-interacting protein [Sarocladium implicatum]|nr:QDE-2-interacting protein [Sarocladium implicatum]